MAKIEICYFGTVCSDVLFRKIVESCEVKPAACTQVFESMLIDGLSKIPDLNVEVNTYPPVSAGSRGFPIFWGRKMDIKSEKINSRWLPAVNIQGIKQIFYGLSTIMVLCLWFAKNKNKKKKAILLYSAYVPVALPAVFFSKLFRCPIVVIETDFSEFALRYTNQGGLKANLSPFYVRLSKLIRTQFDGYVLVTRQMNFFLNKKNKPYIVLEGMVSEGNFPAITKGTYSDNTINVMYAGALFKLFGIDKLINSFMLLKSPKLRLWLFGHGDMKAEIAQYAKEDPRIQYFGHVFRDKVLEYELRASLLVNPRPTNEEFTKYSFPSKNMEYMASGTPVLTTKLPGMPKEYHDYVYLFDDETVEGMAKTLERVLSLPPQELQAKGMAAREFVLREKNNVVQAKRIIELIEKVESKAARPPHP